MPDHGVLPPWAALFGENGEAASIRYLKRGGVPFLFLPSESGAAATVLDLYPAQRTTARLAKIGLTIGLRLSLPLPLPRLSLPMNASAPFVRFLGSLAGLSSGVMPVWGMLAGNPNALGQRLVFLVFGPDLKPRAAVKVGLGEVARNLIARERDAFLSLPSGLSGVPPLLGQWETTDSVAALAMPYIAGASPSAENLGPVAAILNHWLGFAEDRPLDSLSGWRAVLATACELLPTASDSVRAPVTHGDFAPWNIKVSAEDRDRWTVLDWERGERHGVPAWDWFHFVLQSAVLVEKVSAEVLVERVETLLASPAFQKYAEAAGICGLERALLLGYLVHCTEVIRQTEGAPALSGARALLMARWR